MDEAPKMPTTLVIDDTKDNEDKDDGLPLTKVISQVYETDEFA